MCVYQCFKNFFIIFYLFSKYFKKIFKKESNWKKFKVFVLNFWLDTGYGNLKFRMY